MFITIYSCFTLGLIIPTVPGEYSITIHPEYLAQGGRTHFEGDRWNGHNGLDGPAYISKNKAIGTESGRWLNRDLNSGTFQHAVFADYSVTIHPEYLAQGGRVHFEGDRWNGHNGLDGTVFINKNKAIGTESGRWLNRDLSPFKDAPQDPHRKGYADPSYFNNHHFDESVGKRFLENLQGYGFDLDMVMELKGISWPNWMDKSHHGGTFPNNLDAAAEMIVHLLEAINRYTGGHLPPYFEVINEPGTLWQTVDWSTVVNYHKIVAAKLKSRFPSVKVGGPTNTGAIGSADNHDFKIWKNQKEFLDMSLDHMDFFSFHAYNRYHSKGNTHEWSGINEARLVAVIDMIEGYSWHKKGKGVPLIISEYGLGGDNVKTKDISTFNEWAFGYAHNSQMFTYQSFRGDVDRAIAFLLSQSQNFASASLYYHNHTYTHLTKAYQFWHHFNYNHRFLRVSGMYDGKQRKISPLVLVNPKTKDVEVLLHSYEQSETRVKINFDKNWMHSSTAKSTCFFLNSHKVPVLTTVNSLTLTDNVFNMPAEGSCYITMRSGFNLESLSTVQEHTYYANVIAEHIKGKTLETTINVPSLGHVRFANLRLGVSINHKTAHTTPTVVHFNGHTLHSRYMLYAPGKDYSDTLWDVNVYLVPLNIIKQHANTVQMEFAQDGGYVSSVALVVGRVEGGSTIIG